MGTVFKRTATKPLPSNAKIIVRKGQYNCSRLDKADVLAEYRGLELTERKAK
jgi:hypothetical protein